MKKRTLTILGQAAKDTLDAMQADKLRAEIVQASAHIAQTDIEALGNEEYQNLKEAAKNAGKSYADARAFQRARIDYCLHRLDECGAIDLTDVDGTGGSSLDADGEEAA